MKFVKIAVLILIISVFLPVLSTSAAHSSPGSVSAEAACLMEAESGRVLYSKRPGKRMAMASTTKIMTAIVALESGVSLDTRVKIPREAVGIEGSSMYLAEGEITTLETLIYGLLLSSANDSSVAIAMAVCDSTSDFVSLMNKKAEELMLSDTHFTNTNGLYDENHYTTAQDLARLMAYCVKNETFTRISGCKRAVFPREGDGVRVFINHNKLLSLYDGVIAGKTGFTKRSGRCLVTCAERDGLRLIAVTLNAPDDWNDHVSLYNFGFSVLRRLTMPGGSLTVPVISGAVSEIRCSYADCSFITEQGGTDTECIFKMPRFLFAPVNRGDVIGYIVYRCDGKDVATVPIIAEEDSGKASYKFNLIEWFINLFGISIWKK